MHLPAIKIVIRFLRPANSILEIGTSARHYFNESHSMDILCHVHNI